MSKHETHAEIIAEQLTNIESLGDELPAVIAAGSLRKLLRHLDEAHKREIEDAEGRGNHEATAAICETIEKVGPLYDAESVGNSVKLREALEKLVSFIQRFRKNVENYGIDMYYSSAYDKDIKELDGRVSHARAALAKPPRNFEKFATADEAMDCFADDALIEEWNALKAGKKRDLLAKELFVFINWLFAKATEQKGENNGNK